MKIFHIHLYLYIYIFNYINYIFIQNNEETVSNKSTKLGVGWNNLCMLNDFKEDDKIDKIIFEADVNL